MIKAKLKESLKDAMRAKDQVRMDTIRAVISALQYEEIQKGVEDLPDDAALTILKSELKKRKEEMEFAEKANRADAKEKLLKEMATIESYLPKQLSSADLEKILVELKAKDPATNMGIAMKYLKETYAGQYDGRAASETAKKIFG